MSDFYSEKELKRMGFKFVGNDVEVFRKAVFVNPKNIYLGNACRIDDFVMIHGTGEIFIGNRVHVSCFSSLVGGGRIVLKDYSGLSAGCRLISGTEDFLGGGMTNPCIPSKYREVYRSFVILERHAILGTNTIVNPGVTVGEGVSTGSGTVVTKDLEPWKIYVGVPAKKMKERPKEKILQLEKELIEEFGY